MKKNVYRKRWRTEAKGDANNRSNHSGNAKIDPTFNFRAYNKEICKSINAGKYIPHKEPIKKAILISNCSVLPSNGR